MGDWYVWGRGQRDRQPLGVQPQPRPQARGVPRRPEQHGGRLRGQVLPVREPLQSHAPVAHSPTPRSSRRRTLRPVPWPPSTTPGPARSLRSSTSNGRTGASTPRGTRPRGPPNHRVLGTRPENQGVDLDLNGINEEEGRPHLLGDHVPVAPPRRREQPDGGRLGPVREIHRRRLDLASVRLDRRERDRVGRCPVTGSPPLIALPGPRIRPFSTPPARPTRSAGCRQHPRSARTQTEDHVRPEGEKVAEPGHEVAGDHGDGQHEPTDREPETTAEPATRLPRPGLVIRTRPRGSPCREHRSSGAETPLL